MIILWILIGALCGWIVALLTRTKASYDVSFYVTIGIIGSLMGGLIAQAYRGDSLFYSANSLFIALLVSTALLGLARLLLRRA